jgi:hypothetical protein
MTMREKPILFSGAMVKAILDGRKTQTRRVMKPQPVKSGGFWQFAGAGWNRDDVAMVMPGHSMANRCPYGQIGDHLWVRETFQVIEPHGSVGDEWIGDDIMEVDGRLPKEKPECVGYWWNLVYKADEPDMCSWWRPPIYMPRWASRITLEIVNVRVERLQSITPADAFAEGVREDYLHQKPDWIDVQAYQELWDKLNAKRGYGWDVNPWVWVIEFKRIEQ